MLNQAQLESILGRSLTSREVTNLSSYLKTAQENLETLLCSPLYEETETRFFNTRVGYRTLFTDIFTEIATVKVNGVLVDPSQYYVAQFDRRNSPLYSSIVFKNQNYTNCTQEIEIEADWGICQKKMPKDLQSILAQLFAFASKRKASTAQVKSKKVEDFSITFADTSAEDLFLTDNASTIKKYSLCNIGYVRHGNTSWVPLSQRENWANRWSNNLNGWFWR